MTKARTADAVKLACAARALGPVAGAKRTHVAAMAPRQRMLRAYVLLGFPTERVR